jgi:hypothetical protein
MCCFSFFIYLFRDIFVGMISGKKGDNTSGSNRRMHKTQSYELKLQILKHIEKVEGHDEIAW